MVNKPLSAHVKRQKANRANERRLQEAAFAYQARVTHLTRAFRHNRAQEGVIEGAHATMVIQHLHLKKLNGALHGKEKNNATNRTLIIDSTQGQVFSSDDILEGLKAQESCKKDEASQKKVRAEVRAAKKEARAMLNEEWSKIKSDHEEKVAAWKLTCDGLQGDGVAKKNWPKAPTRPRKPTLPPMFAATIEEEDEEHDEDEID